MTIRYQPSPQDINPLPKISTICPRYQPSTQDINHLPMISTINPRLVMGPSPGPAKPGPVHFSRDWAENFWKGPSSTQAWEGSGSIFWEGPRKLGLLCSKKRGPSRLWIELLWRAWARARLKIDIQGSGLARDQSFRARPITTQDINHLPKISTIYPRYQPSHRIC